MHFPVFAKIGTISINNGSGIVVKALCTLLKQGCNDDHTCFFCNDRQFISSCPRNGFSQLEVLVVFHITEIK